MKLTELSSNALLSIFYIMGNVASGVLLSILLLRNRNYKDERTQLFTNIIVLLIVDFISDILWAHAYFGILPEIAAETVIKISRILYYSSISLMATFWAKYIFALIDSDYLNSKKQKLLYIPFAVQLVYVIIICMLFDPSTKDAKGYFLAASLVFIPVLHVIVAGIKIFLQIKKESDQLQKKRFRNLSIWPFLIVGSSAIQLFISELPIFCFVVTILILSLYLFNQDAFINTDPLTGISNRNMLMKYLLEIKEKNDNYYVLMLDIDNFKSINDTFGHLMGDKALKALAGVLKKVCLEKNYFVARYGGDEFIIIAKTNNEEEIKNTIEELQKEIKKLRFEFSFTASVGYAKKEIDDNIEDVINAADDELYLAKAKIHKDKTGRN